MPDRPPIASGSVTEREDAASGQTVETDRGLAIDGIDRPSDIGEPAPVWGSDRVALALREIATEYIALIPGSSFRGLHDSLVNLLGNRAPQLILCLHEEHAVAIAHAYAKIRERPMAVALHSNVGLMHATMAVYNAFCDRAPIVMIGATGPVDAMARRPWIDWLHTAADQAALVRPYVKWDDQPGSVEAAVASLLRAHQLAATEPCAPVYVCLDVALQEQRLDEVPAIPDAKAFSTPARPSHPDAESVAEVAGLLGKASSPVILLGRCSRDESAWNSRIELVERTGARVFTHPALPGAFPTLHRLYGGAAEFVGLSEPLGRALKSSDLVLSLDWLDLGGTLQLAWGAGAVAADVVSVTLDQHLHNGWSKDHFAPVPATLRVACNPDAMVACLLEEIESTADTCRQPPSESRSESPRAIPLGRDGQLRTGQIAAGLRAALNGVEKTLVSVSGAWPYELWPIDHPLDYLGGDGGAGIGSGPGMAVGAALALRDTDRLPVAVLGDGDFSMGATALWTAAHYRLPLLIVVNNNRSFLNDELHQHRMARQRGRPVANRWIGQRIEDPTIDLATLARAQGVLGLGPIKAVDELESALRDAVLAARSGAAVVVDVWVANEPDTPPAPVG
jgi:thiamine pyrophosphate-dependent acetolactate synthase large subunit-like protein